MYRLMSGVFVLAWIAVVAVALIQFRRDSPLPQNEPARQKDSGKWWTGIYQEGRKIGFSCTTVDWRTDGVTYTEESTLRLKMLDSLQSVLVRAAADFDSELQLRSFHFELGGSAVGLRVDGKEEAGSLRIETAFGAETASFLIPRDASFSYPGFLRERLRGEALRPGERLSAEVFDPMSLSRKTLSFEVERLEPVPDASPARLGWRVVSRMGEMISTIWLDEEGNFLREEGSMGFVMVREAPEQAVRLDWSEQGVVDITRAAAIPTSMIDEPRTRPSLHLKVEAGAVRIPTGTGQSFAPDGSLTIERTHVGVEDTFQLPWLQHDAFERELAADFLVQADHPAIRAKVQEIAGGERDAQQVARRLHAWVHENLRKVPTVSLPNAVQVLERREGDCNEHAVLLAALMRAAGIPVRLVAGLVYLDGAFLYHAWNEVWLNRWIPVDATLGQFPSDATHLALFEGGIQVLFDIAQTVGRLKIEVTDGNRTP